jgi:hypothetical protein
LEWGSGITAVESLVQHRAAQNAGQEEHAGANASLHRWRGAYSVGGPYLFGLGVGGEAGVRQALAFLRKDIERDMALIGCKNVREFNRSFVREVAHWGT